MSCQWLLQVPNITKHVVLKINEQTPEFINTTVHLAIGYLSFPTRFRKRSKVLTDESSEPGFSNSIAASF